MVFCVLAIAESRYCALSGVWELIENPEIDIYHPDIFVSARKLAVRFSKEGVPFIPVYPELVNREADTDA